MAAMSIPEFLLSFLRSQFSKVPYPKTSFAGQTVIVTGSNTGLGLEAARHIVRLGASKVILAVRTVSKGEAAARDILASTQAKKNVVEVWQLDLSDYESIKTFGARVETLDRLDALIQNAGILTYQFGLTNGIESHINTNVVSATLVGLLALPKLRETSRKYETRTRLAFVGSDLHWLAKFKEAETSGSLFDALNDKEAADMIDRYKVSKLLLLYTVRELAKRSSVGPKSNVIIDYQTPGACQSDIFRDDVTWLQQTLMNIAVTMIARTTEVGSRTLVHAVNPDLGKEAHGAFLMDCRVTRNGSNVDSAKGQEREKRWIAELFPKLESIIPGVTKVLE